MGPSDKTNVLVVDGSPEKLVYYQEVLAELGENVLTARSGVEALHKLLELDCAVVLLDVSLPEMDGFQTAALIRGRQRSAHTPIIFIAACADEVQAARAYGGGAVDFILEPLVPGVLRAKVKVFCDLFRLAALVRRQAEERVALVEELAQRRSAEEASRRHAFLAEAGRVLLDSFTPRQRVLDLARLPVPFLAEASMVWLGGEQGRLSHLAVARLDEETGETICQFHREHELPALLRQLLGRAREEAKSDPLVLSVQGPGVREGEPAARPYGALEGGSGLLLPLLCRGEPLGGLILARPAAAPRFRPEDVAIAESLAYRGALAIENVRLYERLQEADRRKDEFMAMLAHELRNPLAPIANAVTILRRCGDDPGRREWARELIGRQVQHLARLIDDLLDVARISRGKIRLHIEAIDIPQVIAVAVESCRHLLESRDLQLSVELPPHCPAAQGDPARLAQILANLISNAAKYSEPGGRITLALRCEGVNATFLVRDRGVGIPEEALPHVFDPFFQVDRSLDRAQGGLGVGLALVRGLTEMHGGRVEARSEGPGQGAELLVELPILRDDGVERRAPGSEAATGSRGRGRRVLVVDDNRDSAISMANLLSLEGHQVRTVFDGEQVIPTLRSFPAEVVLLDIGLPGLDGYQVAQMIRAEPGGAGLVLVAVTGYGREQDCQRSREAGFDHHLVKPVDARTIYELLDGLPVPDGTGKVPVDRS